MPTLMLTRPVVRLIVNPLVVSTFIFYNHLISWGSKKQPPIARSSIEAEYKAVTNTAYELLQLQSNLKELVIFLRDPPILWCDNLAATYLTINPILHSHTKHVELDDHFVRDCVAAKSLQVSFLSSKDQLADNFTKPLSAARFAQLRSSLTLCPVVLDSRETVKALGATSPDQKDKKELEDF